MSRIFTQLLFAASVMMIFAVILGAFGAHALKDQLGTHGIDIWNTAAKYHFYHGIGMFIALILGKQYHYPRILWLAAFAFFGGIICFSGSLYLLALNPGWNWLGPITPLGGLFFIAGWFMCAVALFNLQLKEK